MIEIKTEILENNLIRHYAEDENGNHYKMIQEDTGLIYDDAIDVVDSKHTYKPTEEMIDEQGR